MSKCKYIHRLLKSQLCNYLAFERLRHHCSLIQSFFFSSSSLQKDYFISSTLAQQLPSYGPLRYGGLWSDWTLVINSEVRMHDSSLDFCQLLNCLFLNIFEWISPHWCISLLCQP